LQSTSALPEVPLRPGAGGPATTLELQPQQQQITAPVSAEGRFSAFHHLRYVLVRLIGIR
jgi:hypothetical protein